MGVAVILPGLLFFLGFLSIDGWGHIFPKCLSLDEHRMMNIPKSFASNALLPQQGTVSLCFPRRSSKNCSLVWPSFLWSPCFALGPSAHEILCVPFKNGESLFSPVLWSSCTWAQLAFNAGYSRGSLSQCQIPRCGDLTRGWELSFLMQVYVIQLLSSLWAAHQHIWGCIYHIITPLTILKWPSLNLLE